MTTKLAVILISVLSTVSLLGFQNCETSSIEPEAEVSKSSLHTVIFKEDFESSLPVDSLEFAGSGTLGELRFHYFDFDNSTLELTKEAGANGSMGARLKNTTFQLQNSIELDPAKSYRLSFDVRIVFLPAADSSVIKYPFVDVSHGYRVGETFTSLHGFAYYEPSITHTQWKKFQMIIPTADIPSGAEYLVNFALSSKWDSENIIDVDNIQIEELSFPVSPLELKNGLTID